MQMIAPVFRPSARTSAAVEFATGQAMLICARREGHVPKLPDMGPAFRPLSRLERATLRVISARLRQGDGQTAIERDLGITPTRLNNLLCRGGVDRAGKGGAT